MRILLDTNVILDIIVTRNKADYRASPLMVLSPEEFVAAHLT